MAGGISRARGARRVRTSSVLVAGALSALALAPVAGGAPARTVTLLRGTVTIRPGQTAMFAAIGAGILAGFRNGQCTDLAASRRPDVVERVEEAAQLAQLRGQPFPPLDFEARNWTSLARAAGLAVGDEPVPGAVVVWQPGVEGAASTGHVGIVVSLRGGFFRTSEENLVAPYVISSRTLPASPVPGRAFIYP